jgi:hypothetical protein
VARAARALHIALHSSCRPLHLASIYATRSYTACGYSLARRFANPKHAAEVLPFFGEKYDIKSAILIDNIVYIQRQKHVPGTVSANCPQMRLKKYNRGTPPDEVQLPNYFVDFPFLFAFSLVERKDGPDDPGTDGGPVFEE